MTRLTITLPDNLAKAAKEAGLLDEQALETLLREQLKARQVSELFEAMDRMAAVDTPATMSPEEVEGEIRKMRAEQRAKHAP